MIAGGFFAFTVERRIAPTGVQIHLASFTMLIGAAWLIITKTRGGDIKGYHNEIVRLFLSALANTLLPDDKVQRRRLRMRYSAPSPP